MSDIEHEAKIINIDPVMIRRRLKKSVQPRLVIITFDVTSLIPYRHHRTVGCASAQMASPPR